MRAFFEGNGRADAFPLPSELCYEKNDRNDII